MTELEAFQKALSSIHATAMTDGSYCRLCKHCKNVNFKNINHTCTAESAYCCPVVDRYVTQVEADIWASKHVADRDWLSTDIMGK